MRYGMDRIFSGIAFDADAGGAAGGGPNLAAGAAGSSADAGGNAAGGEGAAAGEGNSAAPAAWYASHPDEAVRTTMQAKAFTDPNALATAYMHAQRALSGAKDVVPIPGDDATDEQRNAFFTTLGRPADGSGYDFAPVEGQQNDANMEAWARDAFFKAGISAPAAKQLYAAWNQQAGALQQEEQQRTSQGYQEAIQALGANAEQTLAQGRQAVQALGIDAADLASLEKAAGSGALVRLFARIGAGMQGESGKFVGGQGSGAEASVEHMTPEQAAAKIQELNGNQDFVNMYRDSGNAGHAEAKRKLEQLYRKAYPG